MRIQIISGDGLEQTYELADLKHEAEVGRVSTSCLARVEGTAQWKPLKDLLDILETKSVAQRAVVPGEVYPRKNSRFSELSIFVCVLLAIFALCLFLSQIFYLPPKKPDSYRYAKPPEPLVDRSNTVRLQKSAEKGNADDQFLLGLRYLRGDGVGKDEAEAIKWFRKAAEASNLDAQVYLFAFGGHSGDGVFREGVLDEPVPENPQPPALAIKGFYIGMPVAEVETLTHEFNLTNWQERMVTNSGLPGYSGKAMRWLRATGYMRPRAIGSILMYFEQDKLVYLDMTQPTVDCLFNVFDLDQTQFAQQFVDSYSIPEMTPIIHNGLPALSYRDDLNGVEVAIYNGKSICLRKIPKARERKFD